MVRLLVSIGTLLFFPLFLLGLSLFSRSVLAEPTPMMGRALFEARCASCHGQDARGSAEAAKRLKVDPVQLDLTKEPVLHRSNTSLRRLVAGGHGKMPRQASLTPAQVDSLVQYLRSLQKALVLTPRKGQVDHKTN